MQIWFAKDFFDISIFIYLNLLLDQDIDFDQHVLVKHETVTSICKHEEKNTCY